nr:T-cell receptor V region beta-chain, TCR V beta {colony 4-2} [mice, NOD, intrathyroidal T cells, Peptide Partial, 15 aa] [Mus sp.]
CASGDVGVVTEQYFG